MKLNVKDATRQLHIVKNGGGFMITESERYLPYGYQKAKWDRRSIFIQSDELEKAFNFARKSETECQNS